MTQPTSTHHHLAVAARFRPLGETRAIMREVSGVNAKVAVAVTGWLGSMWCAYVFCLLALVSLPAVLVTAGALPAAWFPSALLKVSVIGLVSWVAQTFIQLVALSILQVSNNAQGMQQEANTRVLLDDGATTRDHTERILDLLNLQTQGGLRAATDEILRAVAAQGHSAAAPQRASRGKGD